jgi:hypothetical protein
MKHAGETALVVVGDKESARPVGVITEADIVQAVADGKDLNDVRILTIMTSTKAQVNGPTSGSRGELRANGFWSLKRVLPIVLGLVDGITNARWAWTRTPSCTAARTALAWPFGSPSSRWPPQCSRSSSPVMSSCGQTFSRPASS